MKSCILAVLLAAAPTALAATHASGAVITNAATLDVTAEGLNSVGDVVPGLVPSSFDIPDTDGGTTCFSFGLENAWAAIDLTDVAITPADGYLDVAIYGDVSLNNSSDPFTLGTELFCISDDCHGYVSPFPVIVTTRMWLDVVTGSDGTPTLDATIDDIAFSYDLDTTSDIVLADCGIDVLHDVLDWLGLDLYGWVIGLVEPTLESTIADLGPELETAIEDAFASATIVQDVDLLGNVLHVELYPSDVEIATEGVRVALNGSMGTDGAAECIAEYDPGGSLATETSPPDLGDAPSGITSDYHIGIHVSDDLGNQALYSLWQGGLLCYALDADAGLPLDTGTLLGLLAGDAFDELFPEPAPVVLQTRPRTPPEMNLTSGHDIGVHVEDLGIEIYADLDYRTALIVGLDLGVDAGVDLELDGATGELNLALDLGMDSLDCAVSANEMVPDATPDIETQCSTSLGSLVETAAGSLLEIPPIALPSLGGVGLTDLEGAAAGSSSDWLGIYAWLGPVSYEGGGCGDSGGCGDTSGCDGGGCSSAGVVPPRAAMLALVFALIGLRRRPDQA